MYDFQSSSVHRNLRYTGICGEGQTGEAYHKPDYPARQTAFPPPRGTKEAMFCDFLVQTYATERTKNSGVCHEFRSEDPFWAVPMTCADQFVRTDDLIVRKSIPAC